MEKQDFITREELQSALAEAIETVLYRRLTPPYSIKDAAKELGVCQSTIFAWIKRGVIHPQKLGGRTLIPAEEMLRLRGKKL